MSIAQAQTPAIKDTGSTTSDTLAYSSNVTAGSLLILAARCGGENRTYTVTDSLGQTWTQATHLTLAGLGDVTIHFFPNTLGGANTVTCAFSGAAASLRWSIHEYSGAALSNVLDQISTNSGSTGQPVGTNVTTVADGELIFGATGDNVNQAPITPGTGYVLRSEVPASPNTKLGTEEQIGNIGTYHTDFTYSDFSGGWIIATATFKPPAAGGPSSPPTYFKQRYMFRLSGGQSAT